MWLRAYRSQRYFEQNKALMDWYGACGMKNLAEEMEVPPRWGYVQNWNNGRIWILDEESSTRFSESLDPFRTR